MSYSRWAKDQPFYVYETGDGSLIIDYGKSSGSSWMVKTREDVEKLAAILKEVVDDKEFGTPI